MHFPLYPRTAYRTRPIRFRFERRDHLGNRQCSSRRRVSSADQRGGKRGVGHNFVTPNDTLNRILPFKYLKLNSLLRNNNIRAALSERRRGADGKQHRRMNKTHGENPCLTAAR